MNSGGMLENVYLRSLEIEKAADGTSESLGILSEQLATITEMMSGNIDPADDFELFVISRLCESANEVVEAYLRRNGTPGPATRDSDR